MANAALASPGRSSSGGVGAAGGARLRPSKRVRHRHQTTRNTQARPASAGGAQASRNGQNSSRPTSPIRMFCGLPMIVAAEPAFAPPASAITNGRGSRPRREQPGAEHRRHREHHDVVGQHRRKHAGGRDREREQRRGRHAGGRDPRRAPVVEAAGGELGREDHQPEQDDQRREVDRRQHRRAVDARRCRRARSRRAGRSRCDRP